MKIQRLLPIQSMMSTFHPIRYARVMTIPVCGFSKVLCGTRFRLLVAVLALASCSPEREEIDSSGLLLSETLPLERVAALVPAESVESTTPDLVMGGFHYGVACRLDEGKRIDHRDLAPLFDESEQHFEQYNPWIGGERKVLVAVDHFGLPILSFRSHEGVPDVLRVRGVVPSDQGEGWHARASFYCELNGEGIVEKLHAILEEGGEFSPSDIVEPN
ncbi:hypothetical protein [Haloferula sp. A504]|uniref:hypothetical protein n=1 Tax=Haloferula sp. A504 TaxID=3373601 RepID=UPI0031C1DFB6|nr:hypothetical protein [Verrucomicrobiaceae bacterium E54]